MTSAEGPDASKPAPRLSINSLLAFRRRRTSKGRPWFIVLALDAGGVRGIIPGVVLARLETLARAHGVPRAVDLFDLIVGTSSGGNIAMGLACPGAGGNGYRYDAQGVLEVYTNRDNSRRIFTPYMPFIWSPRGKPLSLLNGLFTPRYSARGVAGEMENQFGDARLSEVQTPVACVSYDITNAEPYIFRSWDAGLPGHDYKLSDVARATSAAPLYFPPVTLSPLNPDPAGTRNARTLVDGGVCLADPAMIAYAEARALLEAHAKDPEDYRIFILSVGTGSVQEHYNPGWGGLLGWMRGGHLLDLLGDSGAEVVDLEARLLHAPQGDTEYYRVQIPLAGDDYQCADAMDDWTVENIEQLKRAGAAAADAHADALARVIEVGTPAE